MSQLTLNGYFWLETTTGPDKQPFLSGDQVRLLQAIKTAGSINQAKKRLGMSYRRAWMMVHAMNAMAGTPLVLTQTGGDTGGGATITLAGEQYLLLYQTLLGRFEQLLTGELTELLIQQLTLIKPAGS